jgi:hypothetical protein
LRNLRPHLRRERWSRRRAGGGSQRHSVPQVSKDLLHLQRQPFPRGHAVEKFLAVVGSSRVPERRAQEPGALKRGSRLALYTQGLEGLVGKNRNSRYEPGQRSSAWQKMRVNQGQEFVIAGYTPAPKSFDAAGDWLL